MENNKKEKLLPSIVLVCICLVVTLALAGTYAVANPVIVENQKKAADEARMYVLPEGDSFTEYDGKLVEGIADCYIADNKAGMTVTSEYKGFGGAVTVMIGINANGEITGVTVTNHAETPGLGTKAVAAEYLEQYKGLAEAPAGHIKDNPNVDAIAGVTITSNAVYGAVAQALAQFQECGGVE